MVKDLYILCLYKWLYQTCKRWTLYSKHVFEYNIHVRVLPGAYVHTTYKANHYLFDGLETFISVTITNLQVHKHYKDLHKKKWKWSLIANKTQLLIVTCSHGRPHYSSCTVTGVDTWGKNSVAIIREMISKHLVLSSTSQQWEIALLKSFKYDCTHSSICLMVFPSWSDLRK